MKMISRRQRSNSSRGIHTICIAAFIALILLYIGLPGPSTLMRTLNVIVLKLDLVLPFSIKRLEEHWSGVAHAVAERDTAMREKDDIANKLSALESSIQDLNELRDMRGDGKDNRIYAGVLITPNISPYDSLVVDKGSDDGVVQKAVVYRNTTTPIGIVAKVDNSTSVVSLFSSPGIQVDVYVRGPNVHAKATGVGGGALEVVLPHGVKVHEGDSVLLPTIRGERIGTVAHITDDPAEPGAVASIVDAFAPASLRFVAIAREAFVVPSRTTIEGYLRESATSTTLLLSIPGTTTPTSTSSHRP